MRFIIKLLPVIIVMLSCTGESRKSGKPPDRPVHPIIIKIHGANALYPLAQVWADHYMEDHPGVRIIVFPASSTKGKTDVLYGLADIGMYSNPSTEDMGNSLLCLKVAKDAVLPTVNDRNPDLQVLITQGVSPGIFRDIFVNGTITRWDQVTGATTGKKISVFSRSDLSGAGAVWAELLGTTQENLLGAGVYGDAGMTQAIKANVNSLGYDNLRYIFDNTTGKPYPGLATIPIDFNNNQKVDPEESACFGLETMKNSIRSGTFPYPPARDLYFIVRNEPFPGYVVDFLKWIFADGINDIEKAGYVSLSEEELLSEKIKLEFF